MSLKKQSRQLRPESYLESSNELPGAYFAKNILGLGPFEERCLFEGLDLFRSTKIYFQGNLFPSNRGCSVSLKADMLGRTIWMYILLLSPGGTHYFSIGGACQQFFVDPKILSYSFEEPRILSLKILRP